MQVTIKPSTVQGELQAPTSKSYMQRALAAALLREGKSVINNPGYSNDDKAALSIIKQLGAVVQESEEVLMIDSSYINTTNHSFQETALTLNCHESGLSVRMFTSIAALSKREIKIVGSGSLVSRPLHFFDEVLPQLGVSIKSNEGKLPFTIQGGLIPADIEIDGSLSSQYLTGLLMAYGATVEATDKPITIKVNNLNSKPYIDLTLEVMKQFGLNVPENKNYEAFIFHKKNREPLPIVQATVEGDWSGAAFILVAAAIAGSVTVKGMQLTSTQADKAILDLLMNINAALAMDAKSIKIHSAPLAAFAFDATDCPDLFPPLVALAAYCTGVSTIKGVNRLTYKESNRTLALQQEFGKMNVRIEVEDDIMKVYGGNVKGAEVDSHNDHRIAMACAVAALKADGHVVINGAEAINKSYPDFYKHLQLLGADVSLNNN